MQRDLFKDFKAAEVQKVETLPINETQPSFFERMRVVLSLDKIILWTLVNITAIVFIYSFGVEQGMKSAKRNDYFGNVQGVPPQPEKQSAAKMEKQKTETPVRLQESKRDILQNQESESGSSSGNLRGKKTESVSLKAENLFTIQLVTYRTKAQASGEVKRLNQKGHRAFIISSGKFYQVCIDRFEGKNEALQKLIELRTGGYERMYQGAYVRPVNK